MSRASWPVAKSNSVHFLNAAARSGASLIALAAWMRATKRPSCEAGMPAMVTGSACGTLRLGLKHQTLRRSGLRGPKLGKQLQPLARHSCGDVRVIWLPLARVLGRLWPGGVAKCHGGRQDVAGRGPAGGHCCFGLR